MFTFAKKPSPSTACSTFGRAAKAPPVSPFWTRPGVDAEVEATPTTSPRHGFDFSRISIFPQGAQYDADEKQGGTTERVEPRISAPADPLEREADVVADRVMRGAVAQPGGSAAGHALMRKCAQCDADEKKGSIMTRRAPGAGSVAEGAATFAQRAAGRSSGAPLPPAARALFEPRFGHDFAGVRIHTDGQASEAARAVQARAYTVGQNIVFARGEYAPGTAEGQRLLAHELTHVVQQGAAGSAGGRIMRAQDEKVASPAGSASAIPGSAEPAQPMQNPPKKSDCKLALWGDHFCESQKPIKVCDLNTCCPGPKNYFFVGKLLANGSVSIATFKGSCEGKAIETRIFPPDELNSCGRFYEDGDGDKWMVSASIVCKAAPDQKPIS